MKKVLCMVLIMLLSCMFALGSEPDTKTVGNFAGADYVTDGVDDAVQINQALNAVSVSGTVIGYGVLNISPGNHVVIHGISYDSTLRHQFGDSGSTKGRTFKGPSDSSEGLTLKLSGTSAGDLIQIRGNNAVVTDMTLDGNRLDADLATIPQSGSNGIEIMSPEGGLGSTLDNLKILNCGGAGIRKADPTSATNNLGFNGWRDIFIDRCAYGLYFNSGGDLYIYNMNIANSYYESVRLVDTAGFIRFEGGHWWQGGQGMLNESRRQAIFNANACGVMVAGLGHNEFSNIEIDTFNWYGFYVWSNGSEWLGGGQNVFDACRLHGASQVDRQSIAWWINNGGNVITGNKYYNILPSWIGLQTGIVLDGSRARYNNIVGNSFQDATTTVFGGDSTNVKEHNSK